MQTYEINLWKDKKVIEKVVKQFETDENVLEFIKEHFDRDEELPRLDQEKGYLRPKKNSIIITWSKISNRNSGCIFVRVWDCCDQIKRKSSKMPVLIESIITSTPANVFMMTS